MLSVHFDAQKGSFPLYANGKLVPLSVDSTDAKVVSIAVTALGQDLRDITGLSPSINYGGIKNEYAIIAGTIGQSQFIDALIRSGKLNVAAIRDKWEGSQITIIDQPMPGCRQALVITGSDPRGTAFGVFELSGMLGVSPWKWWADVHPVKRKAIYIHAGKPVSSMPLVKYRGIFLNDEDWGLQPWAAKTFEPETGDIGPKTYAKIFELLLRLKANLIWPAMHPSTKAFFSYPGNIKTAADHSILLGSSHAEPMLRNNVGEWDKKTMGDFNYITNQQQVYRYWEQRVVESAGVDGVYTMGMRGIHDSGMEGVRTPEGAIALLNTIISDQRRLLTSHLKKDSTEIPQVFTAYKEVLDIYDKGLKLPDDITLVWPDDNYGYIQRLSNAVEQKRSGGSGVYYHASYWGRPHDYLWLSTTHPALIREEMIKAYQNGVDRLWVLNVGDIRPLEYNIQLFLEMAYDPGKFLQSNTSAKHLQAWAKQQFGKQHAAEIASILWNYYNLAFERKPEFMGWSMTEPTTKTKVSQYNHFYYGDEAQKRIDRYNAMERKVKAMYPKMSQLQKDAFYELVYYPVVSSSHMNKKFLFRDKAVHYSRQGRTVAGHYAFLSKSAYQEIEKETEYFNHSLANGKWKHMMSMKPRDLPVYQEPDLTQTVIKRTESWDIAPEGFMQTDSMASQKTFSYGLPYFDQYAKQSFFIDVFLTGDRSIAWEAVPSSKWIVLPQSKGMLSPGGLKSQVRLWVRVNWDLIRSDTTKGHIVFKNGSRSLKVAVTALNLQPVVSCRKCFIESNGIISIFAGDFSKKNDREDAGWKVLEGLGHTGRSLQAYRSNPDTTGWTSHELIKEKSPSVEYEFYSFSEAAPEIRIYTLPTHPVNNFLGMRYALSVDDGPLHIADFKTYGRSEEWKQNVLSNSAMRSIQTGSLSPGKHKLRIYMIDPGVILDRMIINLGGYVQGYGVIPSSVIR
jgi:hypothetical protein